MAVCLETGKVIYATRDAARGALFGSRGTARRPRECRKRRRTLNVYRCPKCGGIHVGHSPGQPQDV